jgi:hypothetical protein
MYLWGLYGSRYEHQLFPQTRVIQLIFVMVKCGVLFEVRTEFLNII